MRKVAVGSMLMLAACSKAPQRSESVASYDVAEAPPSAVAPPTAVAGRAGSAPGINVTAAPGVAFNYAYAFRLPAANIARAQEAHAQACEKLGVSRCRITGMRYSLDNDNRIEAALAFKLDPALARGFGREGIAVIERAEGMLTDAEITGTDASAEIDRLDAARGTLAEDRARIERELARPGLTGTARTELLRQRAAIEEQVRAATTAKGEQQQSLARTPVSFRYEAGAAIRGFDPRSPFAEAADTAIASTQWTLAVALGAVALLGPPALLIILLLLAFRRLRPLWPRRRETAATEPSQTA